MADGPPGAPAMPTNPVTTPNPDPTLATTNQLDRTAISIREIMLAELRVIITRLDASDKAVELLRQDRLEIPKLLDRELLHEREVFREMHVGVKELMLEKFASLATLTDKLSLANATALTAALSAAEKAVGEQNRSSSLAITKSEQGMQEALKQLQTTFQTEIKGITALMATMQSRLDRGEGVERQVRDQVVVTRDATNTSQSANANIIAMVAAGIAGLALLAWIFTATHQPTVQPTVQYVPAPTAVPAPITVPR